MKLLQGQEESKHLKFTQINIRYSMGDANGGEIRVRYTSKALFMNSTIRLCA